MEVVELADVEADVLTGNVNINASEKALHYYTAMRCANWIFEY